MIKQMITLVGAILLCAEEKIDHSHQATLVRQECTSTREYITVLQFLRSHSELALPENQCRQVALKVSSGCTGAAQRFIQVTGTLIKSGIASKDAVNLGIEFSLKSDQQTNAFMTVFKKTFLSEYLDLDLHLGVELAKSLSTEFDGNLATAISDFEKMVKFCLDSKGLDLPRLECGKLAARIAKFNTTESKKDGVYPNFIRIYEFLISEKDLHLSKMQSLHESEKILAMSPSQSVENFIQAYRYAISKDGLALSQPEALQFAKEMANRSAQR